MANWTFLSSHALVLLCVAHDPDARLRDIAAGVGITERATQRLVDDLVAGGYLIRSRRGRRNAYAVSPDLPLRHPLERHTTIGALLALLDTAGTGAPPCRPTASDG
jgi:hypothetical protein